MDKNVYDDVFCVDCNGWRKQKLAGENIYDGTLRYICEECGCENNIEGDVVKPVEKR